MEHLTAIVNKKAKKWITTASIVLFGAISIVFTILCMRYFKSGVLYKYNTVITSSLVAAEVICTGLCFAFFLTNKEAVYKLLLTALGLAAVFLLGVYILQVTGVLDKIDSVDDLRLWIEQTGVWAPICFIVIQFLQVVVLPIPSVVTVGAGVALFGPLECIIYSYIGIVLGSLVGFFIGKVLGYRAAAWLVGKETLDSWLLKIKGKDKAVLTAMFLLPMFPDDVLCFVAGLSTMTWPFFIIMILITRALGIVMTSYSLNGSIIPYNTWWGLLSWAIIGVAVIVLFIFLYKKGDKIERWFLNKFDSLRKRKKGEKIVGEIEEEKLPSEKKSAGESKIVGDVPHIHDE